MLRPASHPAHHSPWLPPVAFINSDRGGPSHATTTGSWIGVDLEVSSQWLSLIAIEDNLLSRHHHWNLKVVFLGDLPKVHDRRKTRATIMGRSGCRRSADVTNEQPRCSHDIGMMTRILVLMMT